jgi:hypothetical protein
MSEGWGLQNTHAAAQGKKKKRWYGIRSNISNFPVTG